MPRPASCHFFFLTRKQKGALGPFLCELSSTPKFELLERSLSTNGLLELLELLLEGAILGHYLLGSSGAVGLNLLV